MNDYLLQHAIRNVWCNPGQDRQFVYRLAKLTPPNGVRGAISLFYEKVALPTQTDRYHVYQIGKVIPKNVGLPQKLRSWMSLASLANDYQLMSDCYVTNGFQFPRTETYVWITPSRNLIVATRINEQIHDLEDTDLYLRLYSNAWFRSQRSAGRRFIHCNGRRIQTEQQLLVFQREMLDHITAIPGTVFSYINGRFANTVSLTTARVGDYVEYVIDRSIKQMVELPVKDLPSFYSTLDAGQKFILHYDDPSVDTIEYLDDVDVYLIKPTVNDRFMGVYYHHNEGDWLRMLTHKDYSIPVERIRGFIETHLPDPRHHDVPERFALDDWSDINDLHVRLYIRHSGYHRPLGPDANRIQELYKFPSAKIIRAMTGVDSTVPLWRAEVLEQCPYVRFMSAPTDQVYPLAFNRPEASSEEKVAAQEMVGAVYGYHTASTILAGTPSPVYTEQGRRYAKLAFEHRYNSTVFEYDATGTLLGWHINQHGQQYPVRHADAKQVEAITGQGGDRLHTQYGSGAVEIPYGYNHRLYICPKWRGTPNYEWVDITESEERHTYGYLDDTGETTRWVWSYDPDVWYGAVRIDDRFLCKSMTLRKAAGQLRFNVTSVETHSGVDEDRLMVIPVGQLDVILNGRTLIEGLDYTLNWPEVVIRNHDYLVEGDQQTVLIRGYGFCDSEFKLIPANEWGFIEYGVLSNDDIYALHSNRVLQVVIDGHYHNPTDVVYDEQRNALTVANERNGAPYVIKTPPVVARDVYTHDVMARREDDYRDAQVSAYMTAQYPPRVRSDSDFIVHPYNVISVFANKLLHDLREGHLDPSGMYDAYSEHDIRQWCKPYEWLLDYDICNTEYDQVHVHVWPHWHTEPVGISIYQYQFYVRALETYLRYVPDVSPFVYINS